MTKLSIFALASAQIAETGITKRALANRMGIKTVATLNQKLEGNSELTIGEAYQLALFLGMSLDELCRRIRN